MLKNTTMTLAVLAVSAFASISAANAAARNIASQTFFNKNSGAIAQKVRGNYSRYYDIRYMLQDRGFNRINQTAAYDGWTYFRACRDGLKFHIVVNRIGRILSCIEAGNCGRRYNRRRRYSEGYW